MSLWNPYTFGIGGAPAQLGAAPPVLRVHGGTATAEQLAAARIQFGRFCGVARTSPVANQSEIGRLPDGSEYRITVVGNTTFMDVRVAGGAARYHPGIGVAAPTGMWILRPRGGVNAPNNEPWEVTAVDELHGGVGFVYPSDDAAYCVESGSGVTVNNEVRAPRLFGQSASFFLAPYSNALPMISHPFLFAGRVEQLRISQSGMRHAKLTFPVEPTTEQSTESAITTPAAPSGSYWGCISADGGGQNILLTAMKDLIDDYHFTCPVVVGGAAFRRTSSEIHGGEFAPPVLSAEVPQVTATPESAPRQNAWEYTKTKSSTPTTYTLNNPNPNASSPTFDVPGVNNVNKIDYEERSSYDVSAKRRAFLAPGTGTTHDQVRYKNRCDIVSSSDNSEYGYDVDTFVDFTTRADGFADADIERVAEVIFDGLPPVVLTNLTLRDTTSSDGTSYRTSYFSEYKYNPAGEISGFLFSADVSAGGMSGRDVKGVVERARILVHDPQFQVAVSLRVSAEWSYKRRNGYDRMSAHLSPHDEDTLRFDAILTAIMYGIPSWGEQFFTIIDEVIEDSVCKMTLTFHSPGGESAHDIAPEDGFADIVYPSLALLRTEIDLRRGISSGTGEPNGHIENRLDARNTETALMGYLDGAIDRAVETALYAKDPRTGAGFFSCRVRGTTYNRVSGPWGWADAGTRTPLTDSATVSGLISV